MTGPKAEVAAALEAAIRRVGADGELPDLELARARDAVHGDYASPAGMKLARILRRRPDEIAGQVAGAVELDIAQAEAVGGYVNFRLSPAWLRRLVREVAGRGPEYGRSGLGKEEPVQVEFGSINPTGPLHIGHGRGIVLGDSLARTLEFTGHAVAREYYVNDSNTQAKKFGESILARYEGREPPEGGYVGAYVEKIALAARQAGVEPNEEALRKFGIAQMVERLKAVVARLDVRYDEWFWESRVWESGLGQEAIERLRKAGYLVEKEGALWFAPALADENAPDEERVVIRRTGEHTYFASDLGYLLSRFEARGFHRVIEVWGADHHGYVPRMKAAAEALGVEPERLVIILNQLVNLQEGKMSKRAGRLVTLEELIDRVGSDAVRYFFISRTPDTMMEFDLELATTQNKTNPVYYVQYAHARLAGIERFASGRGDLPMEADLELLEHPWELDVARVIAHWPEVVETAALKLEPHRVPYFLYELADRVSDFYEAGNERTENRAVVDDPALTRARLELCRAARVTLESGLNLIGVSAPDRMDKLED